VEEEAEWKRSFLAESDQGTFVTKKEGTGRQQIKKEKTKGKFPDGEEKGLVVSLGEGGGKGHRVVEN